MPKLNLYTHVGANFGLNCKTNFSLCVDSIHLSFCLSVGLSICLSVCLSSFKHYAVCRQSICDLDWKLLMCANFDRLQTLVYCVHHNLHMSVFRVSNLYLWFLKLQSLCVFAAMMMLGFSSMPERPGTRVRRICIRRLKISKRGWRNWKKGKFTWES